MQTILLYWFAAQQQTSTFKQQNFGLFYLKFSAELNKLNLDSKRDRKWPKKSAETKIV